MNEDFWFGFISGVSAICLLLLVATAQVDTMSAATKRGFYTYENKLYVISPASSEPTNIGVTK